jgi:hypothetical protein
MKMVCRNRLAPCGRAEDEGEGFGRTRPGSTLALPVSLRKGEATQYASGYSEISSQT